MICNGAADNAAGVAAVLTIAEQYSSAERAPEGERSLVVAFWDSEEDGLMGADAFAASQMIPFQQVIAYVNFDGLGISLLPALSNSTFLIGPETGGEALVAAAAAATAASPLDYSTLSLIFGQGRSDHAVFARNAIPAVFFTDATNGCYHTVNDEVEQLDFAKLDAQIATAQSLTFDLLSTTTSPVFVGDAPLSGYGDATQLLELMRRGEPDLSLLGDGGPQARAFIDQLQAIADAGADAYDDPASGAVLGGAAALIDQLAATECPAL